MEYGGIREFKLKLEKISDQLECAICNIKFKDAHILQCGHTFCFKCINGFKEKKCPFCRADFQEGKVYKNLALEELAKYIEAQKKIKINKNNFYSIICNQLKKTVFESINKKVTNFNNFMQTLQEEKNNSSSILLNSNNNYYENFSPIINIKDDRILDSNFII